MKFASQISPLNHFLGLHYACEEGHVEVCRLLLESGAKLDVTNREGLTPAQVTTITIRIPDTQIPVTFYVWYLDDKSLVTKQTI